MTPARRTTAGALCLLVALCVPAGALPRAADDSPSVWHAVSPPARAPAVNPPPPGPWRPRAPTSAPAPAPVEQAPTWHPRRAGPPAVQPVNAVVPAPAPPGRPDRLPDVPGEGPALNWVPEPIKTEAPDTSTEGPAPRLLAPEVKQAPQKDEQKKPAGPADEDKAILLGAARNAASRRQWEQAIQRYEEYFRRFGTGQTDVRREYAGILVQAGRGRQALKEYEQLVAQSPEDRKLRVVAADVAILTRQYRQAIALLLPVLQQDPKDFEAATRLASAYLLEDDFPRGLQVFDQYLAKLRPGDEKVPRTFPALLLDLQRPGDALAFLGPLREKRPEDAELIAVAVRAYSRLEAHARALEALEALAARGAPAQGVRQDLADALLSAGDFELAGLVYQQVLRFDPASGNAQVGLARVAMQRFQPQQACQILQSFTPAEDVRRNYQLAWAELHQLAGQYVEAKAIYEKLLARNENDHDVRFSLGALYEQPLREDERAKAEWGKIPVGAAPFRRARVGIASALTNQRFFADAVAEMKKLLAEHPGDGNALARLVRTMGKAGHWAEAVPLARGFIEANAKDLRAVLAVRVALGRALLDGHQFNEAAAEFQQALALPGGRTPEAYYGLSRAVGGMGNTEKAQHLLVEALGLPGGETRNRLLLTDLFDADADDRGALDMVLPAARAEPDNLAALIRLATAEGRLARQSGKIDAAVAAAKAVLALSPTNVRGHLVLARSLSAGQKYADAAHAYEALIAIDPTLRVPRRERARILHSDHQYGAAQAAYQELLTPPADVQLQANLDALAHRDPRAAGLRASDNPLSRTRSARVEEKPEGTNPQPATTGDQDLDLAVRRLFLDYQARGAEQAADRLEAEVKGHDWLHYAVIPVAQNLVALEPTNTSVLFDLGQQHSILQQTRQAIDTYAQDLAVSPREREAAIGVERAGLEMSPQLRESFDLFSENGRNGLARIDRLRYTTEVRLPYGDENEYVSLAYSRVDYVPHDDTQLFGNILSLGFQSKYWNRLFVGGVANLEQYPDRLKTRITFDEGARYAFCDLVSGRVSMFLNNVVENGETLRQNIYRYGARAGTDWQFSRNWSATATYTYAHYSDNNDYNECFVRTDYRLLPPPCELRAVFDVDYYGYRATTILLTPDPTFLFGAIHPYFSPISFAYYEGRLEWKHWLSRDYFTHSNQFWYSLQYALGWDSRFNNYNTIRALFNYDVRPWLSVGADAYQILSPVYDATGANLYLILRCPCCCR